MVVKAVRVGGLVVVATAAATVGAVVAREVEATVGARAVMMEAAATAAALATGSAEEVREVGLVVWQAERQWR